MQTQEEFEIKKQCILIKGHERKVTKLSLLLTGYIGTFGLLYEKSLWVIPISVLWMAYCVIPKQPHYEEILLDEESRMVDMDEETKERNRIQLLEKVYPISDNLKAFATITVNHPNLGPLKWLKAYFRVRVLGYHDI